MQEFNISLFSGVVTIHSSGPIRALQLIFQPGPFIIRPIYPSPPIAIRPCRRLPVPHLCPGCGETGRLRRLPGLSS